MTPSMHVLFEYRHKAKRMQTAQFVPGPPNNRKSEHGTLCSRQTCSHKYASASVNHPATLQLLRETSFVLIIPLLSIVRYSFI